MKFWFFLLTICILSSACQESGRGTESPELVRISHAGEGTVQIDTLVAGEQAQARFRLSLQAIPDHFVVARQQTKEFNQEHWFDDMKLVIHLDSIPYEIYKSELSVWINDEFLNEAILSQPVVQHLDPDNRFYQIEFAVRKPLEQFAYRFRADFLEGRFMLNIIDE